MAKYAHPIRWNWLYLPLPAVIDSSGEGGADLEVLACEAGFVDVESFRDVYMRQHRRGLVVADWDAHTNAIGHRLVADKLYEAIERANLFQREN